MSLWFIPGYLGTATEFGTVQTITVTSTDHGNLGGLGDDDHTQYGAIAQNETVSGSWTFNGPTTFGNTATFNSNVLFADNTYDIGQTGGTGRPRDIFVGRNVEISGAISQLSQFIEFVEMGAPGAPIADRARMYGEDDGAGKTRLVAKWPDGSTSVIATQP